MNENKSYGFATRQIHSGKIENAAGALCTPIYQSSTFAFDSVEQGGARFAGREPGYIYSRTNNPTVTEVENKIADLENGEAALATASGMGAISAAIWSIIHAGDTIVASDTLYGCTFSLLAQDLEKFDVHVKFIDMTDSGALEKALDDKTSIVYLETPCNPNLKIIDIKKVAEISHRYDSEINVIVDNTFASPYLQNPLDFGADIVVHSATKYINGHGDVLAGFVVGSQEFIDNCRVTGLKNMTGTVMSPFSAFLIIRGLKTLDLRMERHCSNAKKVADFLVSHPAVERVYYPGLKDFPGHDIADKQMRDYGGMLSIDLKAGRDAVAKALDRLKLCTIAVSLGDAETLVEHAASMTHSTYTAEDLKASGISEGLVRISVGLENPEDIIHDLKQALDTLL